jgi:hypothetical protein
MWLLPLLFSIAVAVAAVNIVEDFVLLIGCLLFKAALLS